MLFSVPESRSRILEFLMIILIKYFIQRVGARPKEQLLHHILQWRFVIASKFITMSLLVQFMCPMVLIVVVVIVVVVDDDEGRINFSVALSSKSTRTCNNKPKQ